MKKKKQAYLLIDQYNYGEDVLGMSAEEAGEIFQAVIRYSLTGKKTSFTDRYLNRIFKGMTQDIDVHLDNFAEKSIKTSISRRMGLAKSSGEDVSDLQEELNFLKEEGLEAYQEKYQSVIERDDSQRTLTNVDERLEEEEEVEEEVEDEVEVEDEEEDEAEDDDEEEKPDLRSLSDKSDDASSLPSGSVKKESFTEDADQIIDYLNEKAGKNFRKVSSNRNMIIPRLKEGYTVSDFHTVIDKKAKEWKNTEQDKYLRPETLFSPKHFESYLNQKEVSGHQSVRLPEYWDKPQTEEKKPVSPETLAKIKELQAKMASM